MDIDLKQLSMAKVLGYISGYKSEHIDPDMAIAMAETDNSEQIANIYIGQPVRIKVDGLPGKKLHGHVTAITEATGSKYSLVPTDNSAGNFVKVQQRIPVRIDLDDVDDETMNHLRAGMMVITEALRKK